MDVFRILIAIALRDFRYVFFQRAMLLSSIIRSLLWMLVIGGGFSSIWIGEINYFTFLFPGILSLTLLFTGILSNLMLVQDQEKGISQLFLLAPISRSLFILSRITSAAFTAVLHALIVGSILLLLPLIHLQIHPFLFLASLISTALFSSSLGCFLAIVFKRWVNFSVVVNFIIFPVFFLSGALYPLQRISDKLQLFVLINPFSHAVELLQFSTGIQPHFNTPLMISFSIVFVSTVFLFIVTIHSILHKYGS